MSKWIYKSVPAFSSEARLLAAAIRFPAAIRSGSDYLRPARSRLAHRDHAPGSPRGRPSRRYVIATSSPLPGYPLQEGEPRCTCTTTASTSPPGGVCERALADGQPRSLDLPAWVG